MIPLLPPLLTRQSQANSKSWYSPSVTMSAPSLPGCLQSTPSLIVQFCSGNLPCLKPCQPLVVEPSNRSVHPAALSASVRTLCLRTSFHSVPWVTAPVAAHSAPRASRILNCGSVPDAFETSSLSHVWPSGVWKTRPLPYISTTAIGSWLPVPPDSAEERAWASVVISTF